jgi:hypothetical protein
MSKRGDVTVDRKAFDELVRHVETFAHSYVKVGILSNRGGDATHDESGISMLELAAVHEFGSPAAGLPERSFIRKTFVENVEQVAALCARLSKAIFANKLSPMQALNMLGVWGSNQVKRTITDKKVRPLSQKAGASIARGDKRNPTTLVDTGRLLGSITFEVVIGDHVGASVGSIGNEDGA